MKIHFVRHGQSEHNKIGLINTQTMNGSLSEEGVEQAHKTLEEISDDYATIYASDLIRVKETAEILNKKLNLPIIYDVRLRERNMGSLDGKTWKELGSELLETDRAQKYDYHQYGGESVEDVEKRLLSFLDEVRNTKKDGKILAVTSGGVIRVLHRLLNGEVKETIQNASVHEFELKNN